MSATEATEIGGSHQRISQAGEDSSDAQRDVQRSSNMNEQNVAVVQDSYGAVGRGDIPSLLNLCTRRDSICQERRDKSCRPLA